MNATAINASVYVIANSRYGWFGVAGHRTAIQAITFGHETLDEVQRRMGMLAESTSLDEAPRSLCEAVEQISRYFEGEPLDLGRIPIDPGKATPFQSRVRAAVRAIGYGQTISYAELAVRAGAPRAARAVGTVMSSNPLPLLIPCHRVIASRGRLGGFSSPRGLSIKEALLAMEAGAADPMAALAADRSAILRRPAQLRT